MADIQRSLTADGDGARKEALGKGHYIFCYEQTGLVQVEVWKGSELKETHMVERFTTLNHRDYDRLVFINESGAANDIRFFTGLGEYTPSQDRANVVVDAGQAGALPVSLDQVVEVTLDGSAIALSVNSFDVANGAEVLGDIEVPPGQRVVLFAADNERIQAIVQSRDDNTGDVRIAPHGEASAIHGEVLKPESSAIYKTITEITAFNAGDASVWLSRNALTRGGA